MSYVVTAEFQIKQGRSDDFAEYIKWHGEQSMTEPGCRLFTANRDAQNEHAFVMFEIYDNEAAIQAHRETPHYQRFLNEIVPDMLVMQGDVPFVSRGVLDLVYG